MSILASVAIVAVAGALAALIVPFAARREAMAGNTVFAGRALPNDRLGVLERVPLWLVPAAIAAGELALAIDPQHRFGIGVAAAVAVVCVRTDLVAFRIFDAVLGLLLIAAVGRIPSEGIWPVLGGLTAAAPVLVLLLIPRLQVVALGDVKFILALGAAIGYWPTVVTIEAAIVVLLAAIAVRRLRRVSALAFGLPMAPFLGIGLIAATLASRV
jgi:hypothetical protein